MNTTKLNTILLACIFAGQLWMMSEIHRNKQPRFQQVEGNGIVTRLSLVFDTYTGSYCVTHPSDKEGSRPYCGDLK